MNRFTMLIASVLIASLSACAQVQEADRYPVSNGPSCFVVWAKHKAGTGQEKLVGPFYTFDEPETVYPDGEKHFYDATNGTLVIIPGGDDWTTNVSRGRMPISNSK